MSSTINLLRNLDWVYFEEDIHGYKWTVLLGSNRIGRFALAIFII